MAETSSCSQNAHSVSARTSYIKELHYLDALHSKLVEQINTAAQSHEHTMCLLSAERLKLWQRPKYDLNEL